MVVHNFVLEAGDELRVTCAGAAPAAANGNSNGFSNEGSNSGSNTSSFGGGKGKKNKNNTRKQEGGKKKLSGFMKFSKQERASVLKENPGIEFAGVGKKLGEKWRALSDDEKKRY
jgi:hypothetical protein